MAHERTAKNLGVELLHIELESLGNKKWKTKGRSATSVERAVLHYFEADGWVGYWGEGGLLLNLIKAMSFPALHARHKMSYIEALYAQNVAFEEDRFSRDWLLNNLRNASRKQVVRNVGLMLSDRDGRWPWSPRCESINDYFPGLEHWMFTGLLDSLGQEMIYSIASIFAGDPYEYRKGWPDVTMWRGNDVRFFEVKAPGDRLHKSQKTILERFMKPLNLNFALVDVQKK